MTEKLSIAGRFRALSIAARQLVPTKAQRLAADHARGMGNIAQSGMRFASKSLDSAVDALIEECGPHPQAIAAALSSPRSAPVVQGTRPAAAQPVSRPRAAAAARPVDLHAREHARVCAVFASKHSAGNERYAADLLGTSASADEIIGVLAKSPKAAESNPMLAHLAATRNPQLGAGTCGDEGSGRSADDMWARAWAANGRR